MGDCYEYVCLDRRERFDVGLGFQANKHAGVGRNLGARGVGLLLLDTGAWGGCRVSVLGEEDVAGGEAASYRDIGSQVILRLLADDSSAFLDVAAESERLFVILGELALVHHSEGLPAALARRFGSDWTARWTRLRRIHTTLRVAPP